MSVFNKHTKKIVNLWRRAATLKQMLCFLEERLEWRLYVKERPIYIKFDMFSFIVIVNDRWIQEPKNVGRKQFSKLCTRALKTLASLILSCPARGKKPFPSSKALHVSGFRLLVFFWGPTKLQDNQPTNKTTKHAPWCGFLMCKLMASRSAAVPALGLAALSA